MLRVAQSWALILNQLIHSGRRCADVRFFFALIFGVPKIRSTLLGVPIIRIKVFGGLYIGVPLFSETTICTLCFFRQDLAPLWPMFTNLQSISSQVARSRAGLVLQFSRCQPLLLELFVNRLSIVCDLSSLMTGVSDGFCACTRAAQC